MPFGQMVSNKDGRLRVVQSITTFRSETRREQHSLHRQSVLHAFSKAAFEEEWRLNSKAGGSEEKELLSSLRNGQEKTPLPQEKAVK